MIAAPWKIVTGVTGALLLAATVMLWSARSENGRLTEQRDSLTVQLAQEKTNGLQLTVAIAEQRRQFEAKAVEDARVLADTQSKLTAAQATTASARAAAAKILKGAPKGTTLEERITDIDARLLESLK